MAFHEEAFEAAVEIVATTMEESEVEVSAKGGEQVADYFAAIYRRLRSIAQDEESPCGGTFEVYQDAKGEHRFRLKAANGQTIAVSEGYSSADACKKGIESVRKNAPGAKLKEV